MGLDRLCDNVQLVLQTLPAGAAPGLGLRLEADKLSRDTHFANKQVPQTQRGHQEKRGLGLMTRRIQGESRHLGHKIEEQLRKIATAWGVAEEMLLLASWRRQRLW